MRDDQYRRGGKNLDKSLFFPWHRQLQCRSRRVFSQIISHGILDCGFNETVSKFCGKALFPGVEILWKGSLRDSPETMQKLYLSTKFWHQRIKWNYGIFRSPRQSRIVYWWHILQTTFVEMALIPFYHLRWVFFIWVSKSQWIKILIKTGVLRPFSANPTKWSNTLKQFVGFFRWNV